MLVILFRELDEYRKAEEKEDDPNRRYYSTYSNGISYFPRNRGIAVWTPRIQNGILHRREMSPMRYRRRKSLAIRQYRPTKEKAKKNTMTLKEYIASLVDFIKLHPDAGEMRVCDTYDDDPCDPEIIEGTLVLAEEF